MALRQRIWAAETRAKLITLLGGKCAHCKKRRKDLEFDCIIPAGDAHHKYEWSHRMSFYNRMYREGNLQLLCGYCHPKKTAKDLEVAPF